jgi:hypothetical protein
MSAESITGAVIQLNLTKSCLATPSRGDLGEIGAAMLWPNDEAQRIRALLSWNFNQLVKNNALVLPKSQLEAQQLVNFARLTSSDDELNEATKAPFRRGVVAGLLLHTAISNSVNKIYGPSQFARMKGKLAKDGLFGEKPIDVHTLDNSVWPKYRSVASLWAAYLAMRAEDQMPFPCHLDRIKDLLGTAIAFQRLGESARVKQSRWPVLRPGESISIPAPVLAGLPTIEIEIAKSNPKRDGNRK